MVLTYPHVEMQTYQNVPVMKTAPNVDLSDLKVMHKTSREEMCIYTRQSNLQKCSISSKDGKESCG